jgi:hypothetical protein
MTKRRLAWAIAILLALIGISGALWSAITGGRLTFTAAQLQERINRSLPREFKSVTVDAATVAIGEGRIALRVEVHAAALGQSFSAVGSASGVPVYEAERGELFFDADNVEVTNVKAAGSLASRLEGRLGGRIEEAAGKLVAAGIKAYLAARPVYRFKDDIKGIVLKAAVTNIAIEGDKLVITVSLVSLTRTAALFLGAFVLGLFLLIYLRWHPGWGLGMLTDAIDAGPIGVILAVVLIVGVLVLVLVFLF